MLSQPDPELIEAIRNYGKAMFDWGASGTAEATPDIPADVFVWAWRTDQLLGIDFGTITETERPDNEPD